MEQAVTEGILGAVALLGFGFAIIGLIYLGCWLLFCKVSDDAEARRLAKQAAELNPPEIYPIGYALQWPRHDRHEHCLMPIQE